MTRSFVARKVMVVMALSLLLTINSASAFTPITASRSTTNKAVGTSTTTNTRRHRTTITPTTISRPPGTSRTTASRSSQLHLIVPGDADEVLAKINSILEQASAPKIDPSFDQIVQSYFPGSIDNASLEAAVVDILASRGFTTQNTLLATSLCCDELARRLEDDFVKIYGNNFSLGGLAGFPFAGNTGFGAMAAHIPDDGYCLMIYGPHVGIAKDGTVGKVERSGIRLIDTCCGSAVAADRFLKGITEGGATMVADVQKFTDFQQGAVQQLILPHGRRLGDAENRMVELPLALFDSQDVLMQDIVQAGAGGLKRGFALLGGIQINTHPDTPDYFLPIRFDYMNKQGEIVESLLPALTQMTSGYAMYDGGSAYQTNAQFATPNNSGNTNDGSDDGYDFGNSQLIGVFAKKEPSKRRPKRRKTNAKHVTGKSAGESSSSSSSSSASTPSSSVYSSSSGGFSAESVLPVDPPDSASRKRSDRSTGKRSNTNADNIASSSTPYKPPDWVTEKTPTPATLGKMPPTPPYEPPEWLSASSSSSKPQKRKSPSSSSETSPTRKEPTGAFGNTPISDELLQLIKEYRQDKPSPPRTTPPRTNANQPPLTNQTPQPPPAYRQGKYASEPEFLESDSPMPSFYVGDGNVPPMNQNVYKMPLQGSFSPDHNAYTGVDISPSSYIMDNNIAFPGFVNEDEESSTGSRNTGFEIPETSIAPDKLGKAAYREPSGKKRYVRARGQIFNPLVEEPYMGPFMNNQQGYFGAPNGQSPYNAYDQPFGPFPNGGPGFSGAFNDPMYQSPQPRVAKPYDMSTSSGWNEKPKDEPDISTRGRPAANQQFFSADSPTENFYGPPRSVGPPLRNGRPPMNAGPPLMRDGSPMMRDGPPMRPDPKREPRYRMYSPGSPRSSRPATFAPDRPGQSMDTSRGVGAKRPRDPFEGTYESHGKRRRFGEDPSSSGQRGDYSAPATSRRASEAMQRPVQPAPSSQRIVPGGGVGEVPGTQGFDGWQPPPQQQQTRAPNQWGPPPFQQPAAQWGSQGQPPGPQQPSTQWTPQNGAQQQQWTPQYGGQQQQWFPYQYPPPQQQWFSQNGAPPQQWTSQYGAPQQQQQWVPQNTPPPPQQQQPQPPPPQQQWTPQNGVQPQPPPQPQQQPPQQQQWTPQTGRPQRASSSRTQVSSGEGGVKFDFPNDFNASVRWEDASSSPTSRARSGRGRRPMRRPVVNGQAAPESDNNPIARAVAGRRIF